MGRKCWRMCPIWNYPSELGWGMGRKCIYRYMRERNRKTPANRKRDWMKDLKCLPHRSELLQFYRSVLFALVNLKTLLVSYLHNKGITKSALLEMWQGERLPGPPNHWVMQNIQTLEICKLDGSSLFASLTRTSAKAAIHQCTRHA